MFDYYALLRDPRWQKKRSEIMHRDDFSCVICGDNTSTLNVHHDYYIWGRKPWEYPDDSLRTLCEACHELCHSTCEHGELKCHIMDRYCFGTITFEGAKWLFRIHPLARA